MKWGEMVVVSLLMSLPVVVLFVFLQNTLYRGSPPVPSKGSDRLHCAQSADCHPMNRNPGKSSALANRFGGCLRCVANPRRSWAGNVVWASLLTHDEKITHHIAALHKDGKGHGGVFIAGHHLQGQCGIGTIVTFILEYHELLAGGGTVQDDVRNQIVYL